jgi:hypothetical protein
MEQTRLFTHEIVKSAKIEIRKSGMAEMRVWYDWEGGYLEVIFEDAPASMEEVGGGVFERRTPNGRIVGLLYSTSASMTGIS